jgi:hypothetical protein
MKYLISVVFLLILNSVSFCQNILIVEEPLISEMMSTRKDLNFRKNRNIKAWSVQLLVTRDKYEVMEKKEEFKSAYPEFKIDWSYEQPNYRLFVGAYFTKLEATMALHKFIEDYPDAYIIKNSQAKASDF